MIEPMLVDVSPCYELNLYVMTQLENVQMRAVKWIVYGERTYKAALLSLSILPLPMYIQIKNLLNLAKIGEGCYDTSLLKFIYTQRVLPLQFEFVSAFKTSEEKSQGELLLSNMSIVLCSRR